MSSHQYGRTIAALVVALALSASVIAQAPHIVAPKNNYAPADDVKLGQEAAAQARKELPLLHDAKTDDYISGIGRKLAAAFQPEYQHPEFHYTFEVVNQKEINAFALPGGPMFLNRGMIEAAHSEGEVAGVMAHEMSHVALRHGTAQQTEAQKFQIGEIAGQVLGAIVGGTAGSIIAQGSQFGLGTYFLKFSRKYESQADQLGAEVMARAGYDPREMANMFKTIEDQGGANGPEFLSDHPNPGNRYNTIMEEAKNLRVNGNANSGQFAAIQERVKGMGKEYTAQEIAQGAAKSGSPRSVGTSGGISTRVDPPSSQMVSYQPADFMRVTVPQNWTQLNNNGGVTYAPEGAYTVTNGGDNVFTHGVEFGVAQGGSGNLQQDAAALVRQFARTNPNLRQQSNYSSTTIGGRQGVTTTLSNVSEVTGKPEYIRLTATELRNGNILYMIGVAPQSEARTYDGAFARVQQSLRLTD
jgi:Zn-dependent protease with chaperone function